MIEIIQPHDCNFIELKKFKEKLKSKYHTVSIQFTKKEFEKIQMVCNVRNMLMKDYIKMNAKSNACMILSQIIKDLKYFKRIFIYSSR